MKETKKIKEVWAIRDSLFRIARRLLDSETEAADAVQDLFLKILQRHKDYSKHPSKEAFAVTVLKNLCIDKLRKKKEVLMDSKVLNFYTESTIEEKLDTDTMISGAVKNLPDKQKLIFHLRDIEGYEYNEIEEMTGISISAIKTSLSRARKSIRETLEKQYQYEHKRYK